MILCTIFGGSFMLGFSTSVINNILLKLKNEKNKRKGQKNIKRYNSVLNYKGCILSLISGVLCGAGGGYNLYNAMIASYMLGAREYSFLGSLTTTLFGGGTYKEIHLEKLNKSPCLATVFGIVVFIDVFYMIVFTGYSTSNIIIDTTSFTRKIYNYLFRRTI